MQTRPQISAATPHLGQAKRRRRRVVVIDDEPLGDLIAFWSSPFSNNTVPTAVT